MAGETRYIVVAGNGYQIQRQLTILSFIMQVRLPIHLTRWCSIIDSIVVRSPTRRVDASCR